MLCEEEWRKEDPFVSKTKRDPPSSLPPVKVLPAMLRDVEKPS
jgi:hypothetical protein